MNFFQKFLLPFYLKTPAAVRNEISTKSDFFSFSKKFALFMPEKEEDVRAVLPLIDALTGHEKRLVIFIFSAHHHFIKNDPYIQTEQYFETVKNKFDFPKKEFRRKLSEFESDAVIDLNRAGNLFSAVSANLVNAKNYVGIKRKGFEKFFNIQVEDSSTSPLLSYENLLNCLKMF